MRALGKPRVVSLFCGAGGLDYGFARSCDLVWANDFNSDAVDTYRRNLGGHAVCGDIDELRDQIPTDGIDLVIGGPPCQGFSVAGQMDPKDPRSRHVWTFLDIVAAVRPVGFVMENVASLAVNRRWRSLRAALEERAADLGYEAEIFLLDASRYGVPQARRRMFFVGLCGARPRAPEPVADSERQTVRQALQGLPSLGEPGNDSRCVAKVTPARNPVLRKSPYAGMLFNGKGRPLRLDGQASTLPASMGGNRTAIIDQEELARGEDPWIENYHAHLMAGGEPYSRIPNRMRRLTIEEAAALQTFPLGRGFVGRQNSQFAQIGNAVPPRLSSHVAAAVLGALADREVEPSLPAAA